MIIYSDNKLSYHILSLVESSIWNPVEKIISPTIQNVFIRCVVELVGEREIWKGVDETHLRILYMTSTTNPARKKRDVDINVRVSDILQDVMWKGNFDRKFMRKNYLEVALYAVSAAQCCKIL